MSGLIGTWKLVNCLGESKNGDRFYPYGESPCGQLIYTASGNMSVFLMDSSRANFASHDLDQVTPSEKVAAFDSFDAYCGTYRVDHQNGIVVHSLECGRVPNWLGSEHIRRFQLKDDSLQLKTEPFEMGGQFWQVIVDWQKV